MTFLLVLQVMPSHVQQSVRFRHKEARPPSHESPARNRSREASSCSVHELDKESSSTIARLKKGMAAANLPWAIACMFLLVVLVFQLQLASGEL